MNGGRIVETGDYNLAFEIEKKGYSKINRVSENDYCE